MYKIYYTSFEYYSQETFTDLEEAIAHGKRIGFSFRIDLNSKPICSWDYITGLKRY